MLDRSRLLEEALKAIADEEHCLTSSTVPGLREIAKKALQPTITLSEDEAQSILGHLLTLSHISHPADKTTVVNLFRRLRMRMEEAGIDVD